jgi:phosphoglycerate dehydrogenase-like enzyme
MLNIWTNVPLPEALMGRLKGAISPNRLIVSAESKNILSAAGADPLLGDADVAFGQPDPDQLMTLTRLRWVHLTTAGYTRYDREDLRRYLADRKILISNSSSVFDEPCAEHALAFMMAASRDLPAALANQLGPHGWPQKSVRGNSRLMMGQSVLILGYGAIGKRLAELLKPFGMEIHGFRRSPRGDEAVAVHPMSEVEKYLPGADHVVDILPAHSSTNGFMDRKRFSLMKRNAVFYNIGRGTTVDQPALIDALKSKQIAAAYLDVTEPEPLPPDHALWTAPNCFITPHTAGGHDTEFDRTVDHFLENFARFVKSEPLLNRILI